MNGSCSGPTWSTPEQHDGSARPPSCEAYSMRALSCSARNIKTSRIVCDDPARVSKIRWRTHDDDGELAATFVCASHHVRRVSELAGRHCAPRAVASDERCGRETRGREPR